MIFKKKNLIHFLKTAKNYAQFELFSKWNKSKKKKVILLRHDVDYDLNAALKIALIEKKLKIKSTFFILASSFAYNILSKKNSNIIFKISKLGHEIGLHFDTSIYKRNYEKNAIFEANILSKIIGKKIKSISFHNPSVNGKYPKFKNFLCAYDKQIFSDRTYLSDSRMNFRNKNPFEFLKIAKKDTIQILLHPMHYHDKPNGYSKIIMSYFKNLVYEMNQDWLLNSSFRKETKNKKNFINILELKKPKKN